MRSSVIASAGNTAIYRWIVREDMSDTVSGCLRSTHELTQWRDIAYCLSLMNYSEGATKKFVNLYKCYNDKLADIQIYGKLALP